MLWAVYSERPSSARSLWACITPYHQSVEVTRLKDQLGDLSREEGEVVARKTQQVEELQQRLLQEEQRSTQLQGKLAGRC